MVHRNIARIQDWEEPTEALGALLVRIDGGHKGWGVIRTPVQDGVGVDPGGPSVSYHFQHGG